MKKINYATEKLRKGYIYREEKDNKIITIVYKDGKFIFMIELKDDDDFYSWRELEEEKVSEKITEDGKFVYKKKTRGR